MNEEDLNQSLLESSMEIGTTAKILPIDELSIKDKPEVFQFKGRRRSKKDKAGRNYVCGCGKGYLSYPALYTHIKTKHEGKQIEGTKSNLPAANKRGRPRLLKTDDTTSNFDPQNLNTNSNSLMKPKMDIPSLPGDFVVESDLSIIKEFDFGGSCDPADGFYVLHCSENGKPQFHPFHTIINKVKLDRKADKFLENHTCDNIMAIFLYHVSKIVKIECYLLLGVFFRHLREALNEFGYKEIDSYMKQEESEDSGSNLEKMDGKDFSEEQDVEYLPLVADRFILDYLPRKCPEFDQDIAVDIMYDFCRWLFRKEFTKMKIVFDQIPEPTTTNNPFSV